MVLGVEDVNMRWVVVVVVHSYVNSVEVAKFGQRSSGGVIRGERTGLLEDPASRVKMEPPSFSLWTTRRLKVAVEKFLISRMCRHKYFHVQLLSFGWETLDECSCWV